MRCEWEQPCSLLATVVVKHTGRGILYQPGCRSDPSFPCPCPASDVWCEWEVNICCVNPWVWVLLLQLTLTNTVTDTQVCHGEYLSSHPQSNLIESHFPIFWGVYGRCWMGYFGWLDSLCWQEINLVLALLLSLFFFFGDLCPGCSGSKEPMDVNPGQ